MLLFVWARWRPDETSFEKHLIDKHWMVWDYGEVNPFSDATGCWDEFDQLNSFPSYPNSTGGE
jgi:hypothetical protein